MTTETPTSPSDWRTEHLRLTAFPEPEEPLLLVRDWWNVITEGPPSGVLENPQGGSVQLFGEYQGGPLHMKAERGRLDIMRPFAPTQPTPDTLPSLPEALPLFVELATRWFTRPASPSIQRLALGVTALRIFSEIEGCRSALDDYLPAVDMQLTEPRDFEYRTNRRRSSRTVTDLSVNRIEKWSIHRIGQAAVGSPAYIVRLEADLNSDADHVGGLDGPAEFFGELAGYAERLAREGDRP